MSEPQQTTETIPIPSEEEIEYKETFGAWPVSKLWRVMLWLHGHPEAITLEDVRALASRMACHTALAYAKAETLARYVGHGEREKRERGERHDSLAIQIADRLDSRLARVPHSEEPKPETRRPIRPDPDDPRKPGEPLYVRAPEEQAEWEAERRRLANSLRARPGRPIVSPDDWPEWLR